MADPLRTRLKTILLTYLQLDEDEQPDDPGTTVAVVAWYPQMERRLLELLADAQIEEAKRHIPDEKAAMLETEAERIRKRWSVTDGQ